MPEKDRNAAADAEATDAGRAPDRRKWHYPSRDEHPDDEIYVHAPWCKSCGICYSICPHGVLEGDRAGRPVVAHPEKCVACYLCEILCPDMAVTIHREPRSKADRDAGGEAAAAGESDDE
jgi:2-oxoglutarate ferredoxin oxidoreductase subunit delta